jgi:hypothetical protein
MMVLRCALCRKQALLPGCCFLGYEMGSGVFPAEVLRVVLRNERRVGNFFRVLRLVTWQSAVLLEQLRVKRHISFAPLAGYPVLWAYKQGFA